MIATVKGDIHDIGKNIVRTVLENYGYDVLDLGRDVPPETVVDAVVKENIRLVGLSALMTTTVPSMEKTHLEHVIAGFGELRSLQSARSLCAKLLDRWASVHGVKNCPLGDMALLG